MVLTACVTPSLCGQPPAPDRQVPVAPAPQPTVTPIVSFQDGMLTIEANNAPLADILSLVAKLTGAWVLFPPEARENVTGREGPGSVFEVLEGLLKSTSVDYAILGSAGHPEEPVRAIVLSRRTVSAPPGPAQGPIPVEETVVANSDPPAEPAEVPTREALEERLRNIQGSLMEQINARGRQPH